MVRLSSPALNNSSVPLTTRDAPRASDLSSSPTSAYKNLPGAKALGRFFCAQARNRKRRAVAALDITRRLRFRDALLHGVHLKRDPCALPRDIPHQLRAPRVEFIPLAR